MRRLKRVLSIGLVGLAAGCATLPSSQEVDGTSLTQVTAEHRALFRLVGDWTATTTLRPDTLQPAMVAAGTASIASIGSHWISAELISTHDGLDHRGVLTLGFDPRKERYVGTYVDDTCNHLWVYEGTMNADGTQLTLHAEAPELAPQGSGGRVREVYDFSDPERIVLTSYTWEADRWRAFSTIELAPSTSPGEGS